MTKLKSIITQPAKFVFKKENDIFVFVISFPFETKILNKGNFVKFFILTTIF
jgi:hypothetical protein